MGKCRPRRLGHDSFADSEATLTSTAVGGGPPSVPRYCNSTAPTPISAGIQYPVKYISAIELEVWRQKYVMTALQLADKTAQADPEKSPTGATIPRPDVADPTSQRSLIHVYTHHAPQLTPFEFQTLASRTLQFPPQPSSYELDFGSEMREDELDIDDDEDEDEDERVLLFATQRSRL